MNKNYSAQTPGVYIDEVNAFPNSAVEVATAVPAFVGYTPQASYEGQPYTNKATRITSLQEFQTIFCYPADPTTNTTPKQYAPNFALAKQKAAPAAGKYYNFGGDIYTLQPDQSTIYYMYNMVQSYFQNGGSIAYIVSVGGYGPATGDITAAGAQPQNGNVMVKDLENGLALLNKVDEVTMYVIPEASLLAPADNSTLMELALEQANTMQTSMAIFDIIGGWEPDPIMWPTSITNFRNATGNNFLKYGCSYWPYLNSTIMTIDQFDYTNLNGGDVSTLDPILNPPSSPNPTVASILSGIQAGNDQTVAQNNAALLQASPTYKQLMGLIQGLANILPPSGTMAGVWALTDNTVGVFKAPANVTPIGVSSVTLPIDDAEQAGLNVDAVSGKSVNAIRFFNGQGILVWGARTLDGNSQDWRYINVRRTVTMIEQSLKLALRSYVFSPNDANTWRAVTAMADNFLTNQWNSGALQGSTSSDAFSVACGIGTTMTAQDILDGSLRLSVKLAVVHPAEFIVLTVEQQLAKS